MKDFVKRNCLEVQLLVPASFSTPENMLMPLWCWRFTVTYSCCCRVRISSHCHCISVNKSFIFRSTSTSRCLFGTPFPLLPAVLYKPGVHNGNGWGQGGLGHLSSVAVFGEGRACKGVAGSLRSRQSGSPEGRLFLGTPPPAAALTLLAAELTLIAF